MLLHLSIITEQPLNVEELKKQELTGINPTLGSAGIKPREELHLESLLWQHRPSTWTEMSSMCK